MNSYRTHLAALLALVALTTSCGGGSDTAATSSTAAPAPTATATSNDVPDSGIEIPEGSDPADANTKPEGVVADAVEALLAADSYAFESKVFITIRGSRTETEIEGWVDGDDRELTLKAGLDEVTTYVTDGVATVERDGEVTVVPLTQAADAPTLEILDEIRNASQIDASTVEGELNASALKSVGFDVTGGAQITVEIDDAGMLTGYTLTANNDAWSIEARFFDAGETFTS